jgi:rhodanese-related sulfurtransferase
MQYRIYFLTVGVFLCGLFTAMRNPHMPGAGKTSTSPDGNWRPNEYPGQEEYVCTPCGRDCDHAVFKGPGTCPDCGMALVKRSTVRAINTIQPEDVCKYVAAHPGVVLLDVRSKEEYEGKADNLGTLRNAINIPVNELPNKIHSIDSLKNKEIIVYCSHSHRSSTASYLLVQNGFNHVINMAGGMSVMKDSPCKIQAH